MKTKPQREGREEQLFKNDNSRVCSLIEYCEKGKAGDMLVSGPADNHNPFQEKKSCEIL